MISLLDVFGNIKHKFIYLCTLMLLTVVTFFKEHVRYIKIGLNRLNLPC